MGTTLTKSGYLRYTSPKELRHKYVHLAMVEKLIEETPPEVVRLLPWPFEVHHMDYNKQHNCPYNFLVLSVEFHSALTAAGRVRCTRGRFTPKWASVPEWVISREDGENSGKIPF